MTLILRGTRTQSGSLNEQSVVLCVIGTHKNHTIAEVLAVVGITEGDSHGSMPWLEAETPTVNRTSQKSWDVSVKYKLPSENEQNNSVKTEVLFDFEDRQEVFQKDLDGTLVANSSGQPYDPPQEREASDSIVIVKRPETLVDLDAIEDAQNSLNDAPITIGSVTTGNKTIATKTGRLKIRLSEEKYFKDVVYRTVEYRIHINKNGWQSSLLDIGTAVKKNPDGSGYKLFQLTDPNGTPIEGLLDGNGALLPVGGTEVYRNFNRYQELDWSGFNFPAV